MLAEFIGGLLTGSLTLVADAGHMAIDVAAILLGLFAFWISQKPPTTEKTFGYYRAEILAALVNGATLVAASLWIFIEAWRRINSPKEIAADAMAVVALGGLGVNLIALFLTREHRTHNINLHAIWLHLLSDTLGSVTAVTASFLVWKFGWQLADPILSVGIGFLILHGSWKLLSEAVNVLLEGVPKELSISEIQKGMESLSGVSGVHDLHVWTVTRGVHALSAHIRVVGGVDHGDILSSTSHFLKEKYDIDHVTLQLEPPNYSHQELHF